MNDISPGMEYQDLTAPHRCRQGPEASKPSTSARVSDPGSAPPVMKNLLADAAVGLLGKDCGIGLPEVAEAVVLPVDLRQSFSEEEPDAAPVSGGSREVHSCA